MKSFFSAALALAALLCAPVSGNAQSQFKKGDIGVNLDFALGSDDADGVGSNNGATAGFSIMGEYGFMNVINEKGTISAGLLLGAGFNSGDYYDFSRVRIGTRGALHYSFIPELDTYAGLNFLFVDIEKVTIPNRIGGGGSGSNGGSGSDADWGSNEEDWGWGQNFNKSASSGETEYKDTKFVAPALVAGCRYMFTSALGANVEVSWDRFAHFAVGLTVKI